MRNLMLAATALTAVALSAQAADVKLYGVVNKAVMATDDGRSQDFSVVDNNNESTRFGFAAEQKLDNGLTASALFEAEQNSNASNAITQTSTASQSNTPGNSTISLTERMARVGLAHETYGALFIGQQDVATDDAPYRDIAAANSVMNANVAAFGGGFNFQREAANGTFSNLAVGSVTDTDAQVSDFALGMDGALDAADSIRYNSPVYMGFNGSVSVAQGGDVDATVRYAGTLGDFEVDSALGHKWNNDGANNNATEATPNKDLGQTFASASVNHTSGLGVTMAYTAKDLDNKTAGVEEGTGLYTKVGYQMGKIGLAVDYAQFEDTIVNATNNEMTAYGVGGDYNFGNGVTAGLLYRNYDADVAGISNNKAIDVVAATMRVKF